MSKVNRRNALSTGIAAFGAMVAPTILKAGGRELRIRVVGGGVGGIHCARLLKVALGSRAIVTVVSPDLDNHTPPFTRTQEFLGRERTRIDISSVLVGNDIDSVRGAVIAFDPVSLKLTVRGIDGSTRNVDSDFVVFAPGVESRPGPDIQGPKNRVIPPLWTSTGPSAIPSWLDSVDDGEQIVITSPAQPYRCPPAVYERVCLLSQALRVRGRKARIVVLDAKDEYPMQALFETAYADYAPDMIEWIPFDFHGGIESVDMVSGEVVTAFDAIPADWLHQIPDQAAPAFLSDAGLVNDTGYLPVRPETMNLRGYDSIFAIGDAAAAREMSKSADSAALHGRVAAKTIVDLLGGVAPEVGVIEDRCWTFVAENDAVMLYGQYEASGDQFVAIKRSVSQVDDGSDVRAANAEMARAWPFATINAVFGE